MHKKALEIFEAGRFGSGGRTRTASVDCVGSQIQQCQLRWLRDPAQPASALQISHRDRGLLQSMAIVD